MSHKRKPKKPTSSVRDRVRELRRVRAGDLRPNPKNWRTHPEAQRKALRAAIDAIGFADVAICREQADGGLELLDGHLRAEDNPDAIIPVIVVDLNDNEAATLLTTLDPLAAMAEADGEKLAALLAEIDTESEDLQKLLDEIGDGVGLSDAPAAGQCDPDEVPEPPADPITKPGDLWLLGDHRLLCGDCGHALSGIVAESVDLVFTDPPYGHNNNNNGDLIHRWEAALGRKQTKSSAPRPIANDGPEANDLLRAILPDLRRILKPGCCCCCCCCGGGPDPQFARWSLWIDEVIPFKMCVVWDKGGLGMGWHYRRCWECILVAEKPGAACRWYGGNDVPNVIRDVGKIIPSAEQHPTEKPVALPARFLKYHSQPGDLIVDPFAGSGTTLIAAEQLGRKCYGMEISPVYCDVIVARWEKFTGRKATREETTG